jgi:hypothetical protein
VSTRVATGARCPNSVRGRKPVREKFPVRLSLDAFGTAINACATLFSLSVVHPVSCHGRALSACMAQYLVGKCSSVKYARQQRCACTDFAVAQSVTAVKPGSVGSFHEASGRQPVSCASRFIIICWSCNNGGQWEGKRKFIADYMFTAELTYVRISHFIVYTGPECKLLIA